MQNPRNSKWSQNFYFYCINQCISPVHDIYGCRMQRYGTPRQDFVLQLCVLTTKFRVRSLVPQTFAVGPLLLRLFSKCRKLKDENYRNQLVFHLRFDANIIKYKWVVKLSTKRLLTGSSEGSGRNSASSPKIKSGGNSGYRALNIISPWQIKRGNSYYLYKLIDTWKTQNCKLLNMVMWIYFLQNPLQRNFT